MNLSPRWVDYLISNGHHAIHWMDIGHAFDPDEVIFTWAQEKDYVIFTNDLDFSAIVSNARSSKPSIIQSRTDNLLPETIGPLMLRIVTDFDDALRNGAIISFDESRVRVRMLPF